MLKKRNSQKDITNFMKTKRLALTGLLFAVAIVLAAAENAFPPLPVAVPGVKLGLSNIAVMYTLFFTGKKEAVLIVILKAFFVLLTKGVTASALSLCGGLFSLLTMIIVMFIFKNNVSYLIISITGAIFHNLGQFAAISIIYSSVYLWAYIPVLTISGIIAGTATSALLKLIMPAFKKLDLK